jgi:plasmid stabilization system protein ParE
VKLRILSAVQDEIFRVIEFYDGKAVGLGAEIVDELDRVLELLRDHPGMGASFQAETRRLLVRRSPLSVIYSTDEQEIVTIAVAHQSQEPGYWLGRILRFLGSATPFLGEYPWNPGVELG